MPNVNQEECKDCRFRHECQYFNNEGANLSPLIAKKDGTCTKKQLEEESLLVAL